MDAYQQGQTPRLVQSYADSQQLGSTAFVYDNSLAILAYLRRRKGDDVARAMLLGDSFLYAQAHDGTYTDGRVRQAYWVGPFTLPFTSNDSYFVRQDGTVNLVGAPWFFTGSSVSDMSWVGIALAQLFARTRKSRYLDGSIRLAQWIVDNAFDTVGLGGYSFGVDGKNQRLSLKKLTEHNADVYGFFTNILAPLTGDSKWTDLGQHALQFVELMWNADDGFFYTGSNDGKTIDTAVVLEEVQSEAYLAMLDARYADALDWSKTNLVGTDTPQSLNSRLTGNLRFTGPSFSDVGRRATEPSGPSDPIARSRRRLVRGQRAHGSGPARSQAEGRSRFCRPSMATSRPLPSTRVTSSWRSLNSARVKRSTESRFLINQAWSQRPASSTPERVSPTSPMFISPPRRGT